MNTRFFCCMAIALLLCPSLLYAAAINDNEDSLRIRLKNDFRRADKPSAGTGRDIYAWVQGGLIDVNTRYYSDFIGISAGAYYVYKLGAKDGWSTRYYLDGHDSFGVAVGAVKLKPADNLYLTIGRFGTDYGYGSLPYRIPLIADNSSRTIQTISEGVLARFEATENLEFWSMWRKRAFYYVDSATGVRDEGVIDSATGKYHPRRGRGYLVGSWHDASSRYSLGASYQQDVSTQVQSIFEKTHTFSNDHTLKWELMGFYGQVEGMSKPLSYHHETALISGRLTYSFDKARLFGAVGKLTHDIDGRIVYTDIGYPDSLSIDRNKENMLSAQFGGQYFFNQNVGVMLGPIITRGYEDKQRNTKINGLGLMGAVMYNVTDGPFKGLNMYVAADRAREKRPGSALGDKLYYWDVKTGVQYDFMLK
ncbi:glucuronide uptake porin UidC [Pantoea ananatis]|uniref:glucuronide uptake porin UidC n=2 Tax=Pantoea ananas TaxID=553 RepID=UPI00061C3A88|nr:glucuronide uptake porin UidC [Pantoea ananatis]CRH27703.1 Membrane-associated protein UidC [Pantoea ananatis]